MIFKENVCLRRQSVLCVSFPSIQLTLTSVLTMGFVENHSVSTRRDLTRVRVPLVQPDVQVRSFTSDGVFHIPLKMYGLLTKYGRRITRNIFFHYHLHSISWELGEAVLRSSSSEFFASCVPFSTHYCPNYQHWSLEI